MRKIILSIGVFTALSVNAQLINTFPYVQNFEGEGNATTCSGYNMLSPGWANAVANVNDWSADAGGTPSTATTGPTVDYNPGTAVGKYIYTETSGCFNDTRHLESPWFDFTVPTSLELSFAYHMRGASMGTMALHYREGLGFPWTVLVAPYTANVNLWQFTVADITSLAGNDSVQFRIVAVTGTSFNSDMAIDDFRIIETSFAASITDHQDVVCFDAGDGSLTVTPVYGTPPYSYSWDNGDTTATISNLIPGTYCCTVTDDIGQILVVCDDILGLATAPLTATVYSPKPWICTDATGSLIIDDISGGVNITPSAECGISIFSGTPTDTIAVDTSAMSVNTTTGYPCPMGNWYWGNREQMLYRAPELTAIGLQPGNIYGIAFYVQSTGTSTLNLTNWTVKMGCTSANNTAAWNDTACVQLITPATYAITVGWNWFTFDTPFYWNGTDNLLIETCFNNSNFTQNVVQRHTIPDAVNTSTIYYRADNATVCGTSTITGTSTQRPVTLFSNSYVDNSPSYNYIYSWDNGSSNDTTVVFAGTYTLTVTDSLGCTIQETLTLNESAPVNLNDQQICETNPTNYSASPGFDSYDWNTGDNTQTISISTGGTYYVEAMDSLGCISSDTAFVSTIPSPVLAASPSPETFGSDGAIYLSIYSSAYPFIIDWDNDGTGDADDNENLFYLTSGDYTVLVTDVNGCYTSLTVTVGSQVGIDEEGTPVFNVYPNPTNGKVFLQPLMLSSENASGQITDLQGRVVQTFLFNGSQTLELDLSDQERGIYLITVWIEGEPVVARIVLQ